ncbi:hypothetical protein [Paraburkholderia sp. BR10882]|uniref:hypothetical protein n=1 Tax=unclassified Paraburkholderia TaxID=2615204 RepID=UPI0034CDAEB2
MTTLTIVALPSRAGEPDLLIGNERKPFILVDLAGEATLRIDPAPAWSHSTLHAVPDRPDVKAFVSEHFGADAYLGGQWIGSSEV